MSLQVSRKEASLIGCARLASRARRYFAVRITILLRHLELQQASRPNLYGVAFHFSSRLSSFRP